jgi:hypothetical protein
MKLLNKKQLAEELGRTATYVSGMVRVGYQMKYGSKTTLKHALAWLASQSSSSESGGFRLAQAYPSMALPKTNGPDRRGSTPRRTQRGHQLSA